MPKSYSSVYGNPSNNLMSSIQPMLSLLKMCENSKKKHQERINNMTDEEYKKYCDDINIQNEKIRIKNCVNNHMCPNGCNGLLERGNKEKNNNYKRPYICNVCGNKFYREDV